jgi:hypothetical protein
MIQLGNYAEDFATLNFNFNTHKADGTPITLAGTPTISVYENSTTQSTAGATITVDYDTVTGLHHVVIDLSADAFYAVGKDYTVVLTGTGTVDSISVTGTVLACFSIVNRVAAANVTTIAAGAITAAAIAAAAITDAKFANDTVCKNLHSGTAQAGAANTITLASTAANIDNWYDGHKVHLTAGDGAGQSRVIASYVGSTRVATLTESWTTTNPSNSSVYVIEALGDVEVGVNNDKTGYGLAANAITTASINNGAFTWSKFAADFGTGIGTSVWNALTSGMTTASSIGKKLADWVVGTIDTYTGNTKQTGDAYARLGAPAGASVSADVAAVKAETATIVADTNELQTDLVNGGRLDLLIDGIKAQTDLLPASPAATGAAMTLANDAVSAAALKTDAVAEIAAGIMDLANGVETSLTPRQAMRLLVAASAGKLSGAATTTIVIRDTADAKDRITATVDSDGNRTAITTDLT